MKTAVLISGHMRSFARCLPTQHWHIFRHLGDVDFFVSTVFDEDSQSAQLLKAKYPGSRVEIQEVPAQPDCVAEMRAKGVDLPKEWVRGQPYTHEPYAISVHPKAVLAQLWQLQQVWEFARTKSLFGNVETQESRSFETEYRRVIRIRPDLWFHALDGVALHSNVYVPPHEALTPWWGRFGGVNDRFAILGTAAAKAYFTTYAQVPAFMAAGCPLHPESLVRASLLTAGCDIRDTLQADFSTLRTDGQSRPPEVTDSDRAHAALSR